MEFTAKKLVIVDKYIASLHESFRACENHPGRIPISGECQVCEPLIKDLVTYEGHRLKLTPYEN